MVKLRWRRVLLCLGGMVFLLAASAKAQEQQATPREQQLENLVRDLLRRVEQLEERLEAFHAEEESDERLKERLDRVEEAVTAGDSSAPNSVDVFWKNGVNFQTNDKKFKLKLGGRMHHDWFAGDIDNGHFPDGTRFRRAWLSLSGTLYEEFNFKTQYGFDGDGAAKWKDVYLEYTGLEPAKIRVGQFKEPLGLDQLTSNNYVTFLERPPLNIFVPSRQTGLMLHNTILDKRMTWAAGFFQHSNNQGDGDDDIENGSWDVTARLTGLPWYENDGERLLHLGLAGSHREWSGDELRYRSRGSYSRGDRLVDTGGFDADEVNLYGTEAAVVLGPFSLQGEYLFADVDAVNAGDEDFQSAYLQASYFLTGERRPYKNGVFSRVKPLRNFSLKDGGWGAWEVATRYSWLDLEDDAIDGGELDDIVAGLNWYLNPNMRVMWNYVHSDVEDRPGSDIDDADIFQMRLQIDF